LDVGKRKKALTAWVECLRDKYGVNPTFTHTDKDMAEIGMLRDVWSVKIQLCWWHLRKAVRERLSKKKLATTPYNAHRARAEFTFVDLTFVPYGKADATEYEGGARDNMHAMDEVPRPSPNALSIHVHIPPSLRQPTTDPTSSSPITAPELIPTVNPALTRSSAKGRLTITLPPRTSNENDRLSSEPVSTAHGDT